MKSTKALEIAYRLWDDTVKEDSLFDAMVRLEPEVTKLKKEGKFAEIQNKVENLREEITSRWANIIIQVDEDDKDLNIS